MRTLGLIIACTVVAAWPCATLAQDAVHLADAQVVYQPQPTSYQPDASDLDLADQGKAFDVSCTVGDDGHMQDCKAEPNDMADQNFVRIAVSDVQQFVVGPQTRDGEATAGRQFTVTCAFHRLDGVAPTEVASNDAL